MKKALSILLSVIIILQMMVNVGIGIYYHINKEYITKQLCVNRNSPAIHCNGRCYLTKQLKKAEQHEKQSAQSFKEQNEIVTNDAYVLAIAYFPSYSFTGRVIYAKHACCSGNRNILLKPPAV